MASLNKVILIGNLGRDPELRYMPNGDAVANFSIATSETWKDKQTGAKQEKTEWHNCTAYRKLAEIIGQYCKKGSTLYVEGKLQTRKWQDKATGADRYTTEIIVEDMKMLGSKGGGDSQPNQASEQQRHRGPDGRPSSSAPSGRQKPKQAPKASFDDGFEDDIPF